MREIRVSKKRLLVELRKNRTNHRDLYERAAEGYRKRAIELLDESLASARDGRAFQMRFNLVEPVDQTEEYDRAIGMLEMSVDDEVMMSADEYRCYVQDQWDWSRHALAVNSVYASGTMKS